MGRTVARSGRELTEFVGLSSTDLAFFGKLYTAPYGHFQVEWCLSSTSEHFPVSNEDTSHPHVFVSFSNNQDLGEVTAQTPTSILCEASKLSLAHPLRYNGRLHVMLGFKIKQIHLP